ncbi:hypothetical protein D9Q98_002959 [Chlorella vulgaris]|uniref:RAP domain-containing protein n=1 Tax=Chlorella vulgaris TaxID=3077 RepID=A0A9D4Z085_CHLVU|nr:hypothetical protein D9Q98_002959 [Chlorella vulgaris]
MLKAAWRRRRPWEGAGKACAAALERSAPLSVSAAAAAPPADGSSAGASGRGKPADGYSKLRGVLSRFDAKMRGSRRTAARGGGEGGGYTWQLPPGKAVAGEQAGVAIRERPQRAMLTRDPRPNVMSLTVSAAVRQARLDQSVSLNKNICRTFDDLDRQLSRGHLTLQERLEAGQGCLDAVRRSLHHVMDDVNMSTFMHRISRMLSHPAMAPVRSYLDLREVVPVLVQRFEGLLDRIIRQEASEARRGPAAAADGLGDGAGPSSSGSSSSGPYKGSRSSLPLSCRSLASGFWALGNMRYPLSREQLDKIAAAVMLKYNELKPPQLSMLLVALNAYNNRPFEGKLLKVLLEATAHTRPADFEARTLLNIVCAAGAAGVTASQAAMDRLSLAALACLPEISPRQLGSLTWGLGKLGGKLGVHRLQTPILHAISAYAWRRLHELPPDAFCNTLYGFGLLKFHPGEPFMDAAAARFKELLPEMTAQQVGNCVWSFARLEYSPALDRDMWAAGSDVGGRRRTGSGGHAQWLARAQQGPGPAEAAAGRSGGRLGGAPAALSWEERVVQVAQEEARAAASLAASQEAAVSTLAQRIQAHRAKREALRALAAHSQEAMAAALARGRGRGRDDAVEEVQPAGEAVSERNLGDLVLYICTGSAQRSRHPKLVQLSANSWMEEVVNRQTGITALHPYYLKEQLNDMPQLLQAPDWRREAAERAAAEEEEGQRRGAAAAAAVTAAAAGELESLDAFFQDALDLSPADPTNEAAESVLEDPELADKAEGEADAEMAGEGGAAAEGRGSGRSAASAAATAPPVELELDLDAVQAAEEAEEEAAAARERQDRIARPSARQQAAGSRGEHGAASEASEEEEEEEEEDADDYFRWTKPAQNKRKAREEARAARQRARQEAAARAANWRQADLSPAELLDRLLQNEEMLTVPEAVKRRWAGAPRATLADAAAHCIPLAGRMTGGEVGTLLWSYATMRHVDPELFQALLRRVDVLADALSWRGVAIAMWSCAVTRQPPSVELADRLVDRYIPLFRRHLAKGADLHSLCNVAWALAVFDYLTPQRFSQLMDMVPQNSSGAALASINTAAWCQFFQCALYLEAKTGQHYSTFLPPHVLPHAEHHWQTRDTTTSRLQNKVADVLHSLGVPFAEEYSPRANFFGIDIAIQGEGDVRLAVEVDGPQHFASNPPHVQLASTHLRNTLLGMHGWEVVSVPFNHWAKLEGQQVKQEYLKKHVLSKLERGKKSQSGAQ